jgi:predicted RNase H-like nuclease (RuvC/YqgF family)
MNEGTRLEGQPGKPVAAEPPLRATSSVSPVVEALDLGAGSTPADAHTQAVAPDDTPTRLDEIEKRWQDQADINTDVQFLLAEVSRLRDVNDALKAEVAAQKTRANTNAIERTDARERAEAAEAEVSRLQQENALLRRSLEMLTKQLEEAEREASITTEELQHPRD